MKKVFTGLYVLLTWLMTPAQQIPTERSCEWWRAGSLLRENDAQVVNILDFGAIAGDELPDDEAFRSALNFLGAAGGEIFIPAGVYMLNTPIDLNDSITFRGEGANISILELNHDGNGMNVCGSASDHFYSLSGLFSKGSKVVLCDSASLFQTAQHIELRQVNGAWDSNPAEWASYSIGQIIEIARTNGDSIFLTEPLNISYDSTLNPEIRVIFPKTNVEFFCLGIKRVSGNMEGSGYNILFNLASNCRIHSIESNISQASHIMIGASSHISITGSWFHQALTYTGSGTRGYGITLNNHSTFCLIENNIFNHLRHAMMTKHGANGNVFAYNYSTDPFRNGTNEYPDDFCGDISLHGHYSFGNLFEGNIIQNIIIDDYWGPSGPMNTFFRNRIEYYGFVMSSATTEQTNILCNEISGSGYSFPFNLGMYLLSGINNLEYANNCSGTWHPGFPGSCCAISLYLDTTPPFWTPSLPWPQIGFSCPFGEFSNPAKTRYLNQNFVSCKDSTWIASLEKAEIKINLFPVPATNKLTIEFSEPYNKVDLISLNGTLIKTYHVDWCKIINIDLPDLVSGIYFLRVNETIIRLPVMRYN